LSDAVAEPIRRPRLDHQQRLERAPRVRRGDHRNDVKPLTEPGHEDVACIEMTGEMDLADIVALDIEEPVAEHRATVGLITDGSYDPTWLNRTIFAAEMTVWVRLDDLVQQAPHAYHWTDKCITGESAAGLVEIKRALAITMRHMHPCKLCAFGSQDA